MLSKSPSNEKPIDLSGTSTSVPSVLEKHSPIKKQKKKGKKKDKKEDENSQPTYEELNYEGLDEHEIKILKDQVDLPTTQINFFSLFRFATRTDLILLTIGALDAIAAGAALPLFTILFGELTQTFTDFFVNGLDPNEFQHQVNHFTLYFVYLGIGITAASFVQTFIHVDRGEVIAARLRKKYLESILRQNIAYFDRVGAGEVTTRITGDVNRIQDGISEKIGLMLSGASTFISAYIIGFVKSWRMALILSSVVIALSIIMGTATKFFVVFTNEGTAAYGEASSIAEDVLSSIRNTVAFGSQDRLSRKFDQHLKRSRDAGIKLGITIAIMLGLLWFVIYLGYGLAFWQGSRYIVSGVETVGALVTVILALLIGSFALGGMTPAMQSVGIAVGAAHKIYEAIDRVPVIDVSAEDQGDRPENFQGHIEFNNIKFAYPSRPNVPIMNGFSLTIEPGQTVALVGSSGSGKSTVVGLLERFYSPIGGSISFDGRPIESLNIKWLRRQMSLVMQEPTLFSCSIYENICYGLIGTPYEHADDATKRDLIINACKEANAWDFIQTLTEGLDTEVGERGFLMSGGQKQRIAIARALVSQPKILLLDEATSALDTKSEGIVQEALERASKSRTTIVIAHRLSTIRDADKIVVMSKGTIVETGTHAELLELRGGYYELVQAQNIHGNNMVDSQDQTSETFDYSEDNVLRREASKASKLSLSAQVVEELEAQGHYEKKERTRSSWELIKYVSCFSRVCLSLTNKN